MRSVFDDDDTVSRAERAGDATAHIEPLDEWVTIAPATEDHETRTGLIIPASADVPIRSGIVLAVGDDVTGHRAGRQGALPARRDPRAAARRRAGAARAPRRPRGALHRVVAPASGELAGRSRPADG